MSIGTWGYISTVEGLLHKKNLLPITIQVLCTGGGRSKVRKIEIWRSKR